MARSTIHLKTPKKQRYALRIVAFILTLLAMLFIALAILSFRKASEITRLAAKPIASFSANVMPDYRNVSFRSLDESIGLNGWFIPSKTRAKATIIVAHSLGQNRLPFGSETAQLYERIVDAGFHVMAIDLRASGESGGELQTFGYNEWEDVVAAMQYSYRLSGQTNFILYGIGTGVTAALNAYHHLPEADADLDELAKGSLVEQRLAELRFDQTSIKAFILDSPLAHGDDYISYVVDSEDELLSPILSEVVPLAVRMSSGLSDNLFIVGSLSHLNLPVLIMNQAKIDHVPNDVIEPVVLERMRLFPAKTSVYNSNSEVFLGSFALDAAGYKNAFIDFLEAYFR